MVFDVVISRQRKYQSVVLPRVEKWVESVGVPSLASLADSQVNPKEFGLQRTEPVTLQTAATNLLSFCEAEGLSEEDGCRAWPMVLGALSMLRSWTRSLAVSPGSARRCSPICACDVALTP